MNKPNILPEQLHHQSSQIQQVDSCGLKTLINSEKNGVDVVEMITSLDTINVRNNSSDLLLNFRFYQTADVKLSNVKDKDC